MLRFALQYESVAVFVREFPEKLTTNGVFLKTDKPADIGDRVGLIVRFKDGSTGQFTATGDIVWIDKEEEARSGKKGILVRNIVLDPESERAFSAHVRASMSAGGPPPPRPTPPPPPPPPAPAVQHAAAPRVVVPQVVAAPPVMHVQPPARRKWPWVLLVLFVLAGAGFGVWYGVLGGDRILANLGVEYRDGRVSEVKAIEGRFLMGLVNQRSSDWEVQVGPETEWIGVKGLEELRPGDRIGLRFKLDDGVYHARQVTVKERLVTGTIGSLVDKTKGILRLQDNRLAGSFVELSTEVNDQMRSLLGKLKPGDVVESVYAVGANGKNIVQKIVVRERTLQGTLTAVDGANRRLTVEAGEEGVVQLTAVEATEFKGAAAFDDFGDKDVVRVTFSPETNELRSVEMVTKYVQPQAPPPRKKVVVVPRKMHDVMAHSAPEVSRFAFLFNRRPTYQDATLVQGPTRVYVRVPGAQNTYAKPELFLSTGPVRTVRMTEEGGDLVLTFLITKGVTPKYTFEIEDDKLIAVFFKQ